MESHVAVDPDTGWGKVTISGEIAPKDFHRLLEAAWSDPAYSRVDTAIWNFLDARTTMRLDELMQLTAWISATKGERGARTIALVAADDLIFGLGRMFHALQPELGWQVSVFRDEAAATAWLREQAGR